MYNTTIFWLRMSSNLQTSLKVTDVWLLKPSKTLQLFPPFYSLAIRAGSVCCLSRTNGLISFSKSLCLKYLSAFFYRRLWGFTPSVRLILGYRLPKVACLIALIGLVSPKKPSRSRRLHQGWLIYGCISAQLQLQSPRPASVRVLARASLNPATTSV